MMPTPPAAVQVPVGYAEVEDAVATPAVVALAGLE